MVHNVSKVSKVSKMNLTEFDYKPDYWVVITVKETGLSKLLTGWSGGYLYGSSWRMSSGITEIQKHDKCYYVKNESGSLYCCHEDCQGMNSSSWSIFDQIKDKVDLIENIETLSQYKGVLSRPTDEPA